MSRTSLKRSVEISTFPNVINTQNKIKGNWNSSHFKNENPIVLELACGNGEYTIELAQKFPQKNFVGIDNKGARIWKGAKTALQFNLHNAAFLNILIQEITNFFEKDEISEIWIPFPDPFPKTRHAKHRLTSFHYLDLYRKILKKGAVIHLKTDDWNFFNYAKKVIEKESGTIHEAIEDLHNSKIENELLSIKTTYERKYLRAGKKIKYLRFSF